MKLDKEETKKRGVKVYTMSKPKAEPKAEKKSKKSEEKYEETADESISFRDED
jgi:hypothetical protein